MNADPRVMEYFPAPLTPEQSAEFMERIREEFSTEGFGLYAVERREDGELLGYTGLHRVTFTGMKDKSKSVGACEPSSGIRVMRRKRRRPA